MFRRILPAKLPRQSISTHRCFSSQSWSLFPRPIVTCYSPSYKVRKLFVKEDSLLTDFNITPDSLYTHGIHHFKKGNYETGFLAWQSAFGLALDGENQIFFNDILDHCKNLKISITNYHFDLLAIHHGKVKEIFSALVLHTRSSFPKEKNAAIFEAILENVSQLKYLEYAQQWLLKSKIYSSKNLEKLIPHISIMQDINKILLYSDFYEYAENPKQLRQTFFDTLMNKAYLASSIAEAATGPAAQGTLVNITQEKLEKFTAALAKGENPHKPIRRINL